MCGVIGLVAKQPVNQTLYDGLTILQHRGQDAAGIMTCDGHQFFLRKQNGMVRDVFQIQHMLALRGNIGIGQVRYPTAGTNSAAEAQPFYVNSPYGIALAHNGNLTNGDNLRQHLMEKDLRHINTGSDSEVLLNIFAHELQQISQAKAVACLSADDVFCAITRLHNRCRGAYAAIAMIAGCGIVAFRDPHGIRPMVYGKRETATGTEYLIASESVALDVLGFTLIGDVKPGEAIFITMHGQLHTKCCSDIKEHTPCLFEYVYFARPDSIIDGISVHKARLRMGEALADKILSMLPQHDIDVVIPIPDSSRTAALPLAYALGVKYREGFVKNRYIPRTFIMPQQSVRKKSVRQKLNAIGLEFKGKNVLLMDDSIVRGTTAKEIVQMAREAGAKKIYFASAAPPVCYPNVYGIDMPSSKELIAHQKTTAEIAKLIGVDWIIYQELAGLIESTRHGQNGISCFDTSCFTGEYITGDVDPAYLRTVEEGRYTATHDSSDMTLTNLTDTFGA